MNKTFAISLGLAVLMGAGYVATASAASPAEPEVVYTKCADCHGHTGQSIASTYPKLNGQTAEYIENQLKAFQSHTRSDPHAQAYMWGMSSGLDAATIQLVAQYYAAQAPMKFNPPNTPEAMAGKKIFTSGAPAQNVPACNACHGDEGQGNGSIPRIAGQHRAYLIAQLRAFRNDLRKNDTMHANVKDMTDQEILQVATYLGAP